MGARFTSSATRAFRARSVMPGAGSGGGGHGLGFGPNLTPMVDVMMVILIFFMAATAFLGPEWFLRSSLPAAAPQPEPIDSDSDTPAIVLPTMRLRVVLRQESGKTVAEFEGAGAQPLDRFLEAFGAAAPGLVAGDEPRSITISPTGGVPWEDVIAVHEAASGAGFGAVRLE
ncbi:MAG: biopolymer transport protein ExbD [Phycisphaerales bacterium]|jgi:biopolymer transport protein ExbD